MLEMELESRTEIKAEDNAEQFFGNLLMKGNACPVEAVDWTKEAIITVSNFRIFIQFIY